MKKKLHLAFKLVQDNAFLLLSNLSPRWREMRKQVKTLGNHKMPAPFTEIGSRLTNNRDKRLKSIYHNRNRNR